MKLLSIINGKEKAIDYSSLTNTVLMSNISVDKISFLTQGEILIVDIDLEINTNTLIVCDIIVNKDISLYVNNDVCIDGYLENKGKVLGNGCLLHTKDIELINIFCRTNKCSGRSAVIENATIYIDCFLGNDNYSGISKNQPKRSIEGAKNLIISKCSTSTEDVVVNLRSGRYELNSLLLINFPQINNNSRKLIFKSNANEKVIISSKIRAFNLTESNKEGDWYKIQKPDYQQYFQLVDHTNDSIVDLANSDYCVDNSELLYSDSPILLIDKNGIKYAKILLSTQTTNWLNTFEKSQIETWLINVPQWFTNQFSKIVEYNSLDKYILYEIEQNLDEAYWNGYKLFNNSKIPFWIYGKIRNDSQKNSFWTDSQFLYVKRSGYYISSDPNLNEGIRSTSTGKITFENIEFKYFTDIFENLKKNNYTNITSRSSVITFHNQAQTEFINTEFQHCVQNCILLYNQSNYLIYNSKISDTGESAIVAYGNGKITLNEFKNCSNLSPHKGAVYTDQNSRISLNKFRDIGYCAIRFVLQPELIQNHEISNNDIRDIGVSKSKKSKISDGAAIYGYGSNPNGTFSDCKIYENRIIGVKSDSFHRGIFLDDGVQNVSIYDNLILQTDSYSIDIRQVNGITDKNNVYNNICQKGIRLEGLSVNLQYGNIVLDSDIENKFQNTTSTTTKKIAYKAAEKLKLRINDLPFIPKYFIFEYLQNEVYSENISELYVEKVSIYTNSKSKLGSGGVVGNIEQYNLEAVSSGDRLVGRSILGTFIENGLLNIKKFLYEFLGNISIVGIPSITTFKNKILLSIIISGAKTDSDYSGIDFTGNKAGNTNENPTGRIAVRSSNQGSYMKFGTSNSYASGITNEAFNIDPAGNVGFGGETNPNSSIGVKVFGKKVFKGGSLTTAEINILTGLEEGCEVWDTTIKKKKLWNGTTWEVIQSS